MNTAGRRAEIISILMVRRRITAKELAEEFNVTVRTIQNDIQALSLGFPIYTRQGGDGGIFVGDNYKPYMNTLTPLELKVLHEMYGLADGIHKKFYFSLSASMGRINWNSKLVILVKHIIFTTPFIADGSGLCAFGLISPELILSKMQAEACKCTLTIL